MTITSTGPSGLHLKPIVTVFAAAVFAIAIVAIVLWTGTDNPPSSPTPIETATEAVTPDVAPSANWDAYADGKLDDSAVEGDSTTHQPVVSGGHQEY